MPTRLRQLAALVLVALLAAACGASQRQAAISKAFAGATATEDEFVAWADRHEGEIIDATVKRGGTLADYRLEVAEHRARVDAVLAAFRTLYRLLVLAGADQNTPLADVVARVTAVVQAARELQTGTGGTP